MQFAVIIVAVVVCATVAYKDLRTRRIPNALPLSIAVLGVVRIALAQDPAAGVCTLAVGGATFTATFALFWYGAIGGGDAKMIAATTLLIGYQQVLGFLFLMSLCGGALALATLATERVGSARSCPDETQRGLSPAGRVRHWPVRQRSTVPYGVAVAAAGIVSLLVAR